MASFLCGQGKELRDPRIAERESLSRANKTLRLCCGHPAIFFRGTAILANDAQKETRERVQLARLWFQVFTTGSDRREHHGYARCATSCGELADKTAIASHQLLFMRCTTHIRHLPQR